MYGVGASLFSAKGALLTLQYHRVLQNFMFADYVPGRAGPVRSKRGSNWRW
jgi:hypothetical protein